MRDSITELPLARDAASLSRRGVARLRAQALRRHGTKLDEERSAEELRVAREAAARASSMTPKLKTRATGAASSDAGTQRAETQHAPSHHAPSSAEAADAQSQCLTTAVFAISTRAVLESG